MTIYEPGSEVAYGHKHEFEYLRERMWDTFYRMSFAERLLTILEEGKAFIVFGCGIAAYSLMTPYTLRIVELFSISAYAASDVPQFAGMSKADWVLMYAVAAHLVLLCACAGCFLHMLVAKKKNTWVAKTGTFLLGFLVKSITGFAAG